MNKKYILYNTYSGNGTCHQKIDALTAVYKDAVLIDMKDITDYEALFNGLGNNIDVIICGGDGTLNRFVNDTNGIDIKNKLFYYPIGSGNDFARDIGKEKGTFPTFAINEYIANLPTVTVNGKSRRFINGVGYGIDGYCCEAGDSIKEQNAEKGSSKPVNYTSIAIKGLLFNYRPTNATVTVDGISHTYKNVWLTPVMNGRFYGGGMMPTPEQNRLCKDGKLSVMIMHGSGKLRTLSIFPSIFKGKHIKHKKYVEILCGHDIRIEFDRPSPLQIDGETVPNVSCMEAHGTAIPVSTM